MRPLTHTAHMCAFTGPKHLTMTITRGKLEALVKELLERTRAPCLTCLKDAGVAAKDITEVLLVGGMSRMPKVHEIVRELFGREPSRGVNPDEVVAMGAAIQVRPHCLCSSLLCLVCLPCFLGAFLCGGVGHWG